MKSGKKVNARLQADDFNQKIEYDLLRQNNPDAGAIVCFVGLVREWASKHDNQSAKRVQTIDLSIYPRMTQKSVDTIATQTAQRFDIQQLQIIHRYGQLGAGEQIVYVGVAGRHRNQAFSAAEMAMDKLKSEAVFWKKEHYTDTQDERWIEPTQADRQSLSRWDD